MLIWMNRELECDLWDLMLNTDDADDHHDDDEGNPLMVVVSWKKVCSADWVFDIGSMCC